MNALSVITTPGDAEQITESSPVHADAPEMPDSNVHR
jgi:hypothetical protein